MNPAPQRLVANIPDSGLHEVEFAHDGIRDLKPIGPTSDAFPSICPGFVDTQINGFNGVDFSDLKLSHDAVSEFLKIIWSTGVTTILPTLISNSIEHLEAAFRNLEKLRQSMPAFNATAPAYHLEGPFLSDGPSAGAHRREWMRDPSWELFSRLNKAANGRIRIITIAPERSGAAEFARTATANGIIVAIGHSDGTPSHVHALAAAGASLSTHLGNGCPQKLDRHNAPFWAQLNLDQLQAGLICDGFHLSDEMIRLIYRVKGPENCLLVSDAVHVGGLAPGPYSLQGKAIELLASGQVVTADRASMAGSSLTMDNAVQHFQSVTGCSLSTALKCAGHNPARLLPPESACRAIRPGQPANFVLFHQHPKGLHILETYLHGNRVFKAD